MYIFSERSKVKNEKHLVEGVERWVEVTPPGIYEHPTNLSAGLSSAHQTHKSSTEARF
jgi:hypothetical protein